MLYVTKLDENYNLLFWTGDGWSPDRAQAKIFNSSAEARQEMAAHGIKTYTYRYITHH